MVFGGDGSAAVANANGASAAVPINPRREIVLIVYRCKLPKGKGSIKKLRVFELAVIPTGGTESRAGSCQDFGRLRWASTSN